MKNVLKMFLATCICLVSVLLVNPSVSWAGITLEEAEPVDWRVLVISIDPDVTYQSKTYKASDYLGFSLQQSIDSLAGHIYNGSNGLVHMQVVNTIRMNEYPKYVGFDSMTEEQFLQLFPGPNSWHNWWVRNEEQNVLPDGIDSFHFDYNYFIEKNNLVQRKNNNEFDAVIVFSIDPSSMYESNIVGNGVFYCNGIGIKEDCDNFPLLGLTFSRQDGAFEAFCHCAEAILNLVYGVDDVRYNSTINFQDISELNTWEKFFYNKARAESSSAVYGVGQVHFAPNSNGNYDWENSTTVKSYYQDFLDNYPNIGQTVTDFSPYNTYLPYPVGSSSGEAHHEWWLSLMPHFKGRDENGYSHNWWEYILRMDPVCAVDYVEEYADGVIQLKKGETLDKLQIVLEYLSQNEEQVDIINTSYTLSSNGHVTENDGVFKAVSSGEEELNVYYDGKKITYRIVVTCEGTEKDAKSFVERLYTILLNCEVDEEGLAYWTDILNRKLDTGANVAANMIFSDEFQNSNLSNVEYITRLYKTVFDREPDEQGMVYWLGVLSAGEPRINVGRDLLNSTEFEEVCAQYGILAGKVSLPETNPDTETDSATQKEMVQNFVKRLYRILLNREVDEAGLAYWSNVLITKQDTGARVAGEILFSDELKKRNLSNEEYVICIYTTVLDREPEEEGKDYWVKVLANGEPRNNVGRYLLNSPEFGVICQKYNIIQGFIDVVPE